MATVIIYERKETRLSVVGRWEDGTWVLDKRDFAERPNMEKYDAELLLDRFDGPIYFSVREKNLPLTMGDIEIETNANAVGNDGAERFAERRAELANRLEEGELDRSQYSEEAIEEIKSYPEYDG